MTDFFGAIDAGPEKASIKGVNINEHDVRFRANIGLSSAAGEGRISAMCGRLRVGKENLHVAGAGRCSHVFGLLARFA